jgi:hypothetical protein
MSKKSKKKVVRINHKQLLHQLLRTECRCNEREVEIIDALMQNMMPTEDVQPMMDIHEGKVAPKQRPVLHLDMGDGEVQSLQLTNHPKTLAYEYLIEKYGHRFGTLYWLALGQTSEKFYPFLRRISKTPMFDDILADDEAQRGNEAE